MDDHILSMLSYNPSVMSRSPIHPLRYMIIGSRHIRIEKALLNTNVRVAGRAKIVMDGA